MPRLWKCCFFIYIFLGAGLISSIEANVFIDNCVNTTQLNSSSCIKSYGELYNTLTSLDNSFKIESALYPAMKPSSVLVKVTLYGLNGTEKTAPVRYTWSLYCLYVAIPVEVLELLSLGSIIVAHRTQELNITIPLFCCNVSERGQKIKDVLAALEDLAVKPGLRDPTLNTAECVVEGHEPAINGTGPGNFITGMAGHGHFISGMLWCSFLFTLITSVLLALFLLSAMKESESEPSAEDSVSERAYEKFKKKCKRIMTSMKISCFFLFLLELALFIRVLVCSYKRGSPNEIYIFVAINWLESLLIAMCFNSKCSANSCSAFFLLLSINPTIYHFCWLAISMMLNPLTWSLAFLLLVCALFAACTSAVYIILISNEGKTKCEVFCSKALWICVFMLFAIYLFAATVFLAGKSFNGKDTADDVVRSVLLYLIGGFVTYLGWSSSSQETTSERDGSLHSSAAPEPPPSQPPSPTF